MAYVRRPEEEEALLQQQLGAAPQATAPASGGASSAPGAPPAAAGPAKGSGYTNLDAYISANRGGAASMAQGLADSAESKAQFGRGAVDMARGAFGASVAAGTPQYAPGGAKPGDYTGPTSIDDFAGGSFAGAQESAQKGYDAVAGLGTWTGRQTALQDAYGKQGHYGTGAQGLDTFLSGAGQGGRYDALKQKYGDLPSAWGEARKEAGAQVDAAKAGAGAAQQAYADYAAAQAQQQTAAQQAAQARQEEQARERKRAGMQRRAGPKGYGGLDDYGQP